MTYFGVTDSCLHVDNICASLLNKYVMFVCHTLRVKRITTGFTSGSNDELNFFYLELKMSFGYLDFYVGPSVITNCN